MVAASSSSQSVELRPYQSACLEAAKERNILAVLPTNSGKTLIAASLAEWYFSRTPPQDRKKVIFLANTGPLVEQQAAVLAAHLGAVPWDSAEQSGEVPLRLRAAHGQLGPAERGEDGAPRDAFGEAERTEHAMGPEFWRSAEVFVMTPGFLRLWLMHGYLQMQHVGLFLLDEAHHTQGNDPYSVLMRRFYFRAAPAARPRVLALTASPFKGRARDAQVLHKDLRELEDLLDCCAWSSSDCCPPEAEPKLELFAAQGLTAVADSFLQACAGVLETTGGAGEPAADAVMAGKAMRRLKAIVAGEPPLCQPMGAWAGVEALHLLREVGAPAGGEAASRCEDWLLFGDEDERDSNDGASRKKAEAVEKAWRGRCGRLFAVLEAWERAHRSQHGPRALEGEVSEDLKTLSALLRERNRVEMRALVFVQTRLRASLVQRFLERDPELRGHTASVVSAGGGGAALRPGMSVKDQRAALDGFRSSGDFGSDSVRVLISTSVLEEGIDVPNCSAVIRFDPPQTPLENIQSRGRARRQGSEYIHIVAEGPVGAKHRDLLADFDTHESALRSLLASQDVATSRPRSSLGTAEEAPGEVLTVPATGATVPMEMAVEFLAMVYVHYDRDLDDSIHFAETAFRTKERKGQPSNYQFVQVSSNRWCCELRLPRVGGCSVAMKSEAVVCSEELPKEEAKQSAALAGIRKLHELGVLNDRLFVEGRAEYMALLRQAKTGHAIGVGRRHRSDDQIALRTKEELVRKLPDCLRAPEALGAPRGLVLHRFRVFTEAEDLGLLLPAAVPGGPLPFVLAPPRDAPLQCALVPEGSPLHLTDAELGEVAHWTASAMELACVQKVLASSAAPLSGELRVPRIKHDWGGYQAKAVDAGAVEDGCERAWFAVVPLAPTGDIDWELLRWGLSSMERASFQPLLPGDAEQSARASLLQGRAALPGLRGRSLALRDAVLLHPDPRRPRRLQVFGYAAASEAPAAAPAGGGAGAGGLLLEAAIIHRGVENVVSAATCTNGGSQTAAATKTEVLRLTPQQCLLLPLTVSQLVLLKYLPGILWRVEHLAVMRELELDWASSMAGGASLRRLAEATTHTVASAPLAELPAQGLPVASWQCDYERLEFLGDAVLKCLAGAWAYAVLPGAPEGRLSRESQVLQTNRFLRRCMLCMGWQKVMLARAFGPKQPLDALRKQTVSQKHEADVVEGLLGAAFCRAAPLETARIGNKGSVDAATAFFARFLLPRRAEAVRGSVGGHGPDADGVGRQVTPSMGCFSEMLLSSVPAGCKQSFEDGEAHPQETVAERVFHYRFRDRRILRQALAAKAGATLGGPCADGHASEFERLEFLGDAALQLLVSQYLVSAFPRLDEGELSELRMALVCNRYLAKKLVRRFASEVEAGYPHCYFPQTLQGPVKAFASRLLREQPSREADFVVGRGEGFAASALAGTAARAAEVTEGPKCVADLYEALVGAMLLDSDGDLAKVWEVIRTDFEVSPDAAGRGLERWREVLRGLARGALRRVPAATAQPDPDRAGEARGGWPAKLDAQRRAIELKRREEAQVVARGGLAGPDLAAALQQSPAFEGADAGEWLQRQGGLREGLDASSVAAALAALEPSAVGDAVVASGASASATAASSADSGAGGVAGAGDAAVGAGAAGTGCSAASVVALGLPLQDPRAATAGHALPTPARAMAPPPPATVAHPEVNARNRLQELLQRHWRRMLTPEDIDFDSHRGAGDAQYASVSIRMPAGEGRLSFVGAGRTQTQAQMAAAEAALASNEVLAAFSPGHGTGFEGVLQEVIGRAGEGGWLLKTLGQELEVAVARQRFGVPNKRKLKDVLAACPQRFELFGEGDSLAVRLRAGS